MSPDSNITYIRVVTILWVFIMVHYFFCGKYMWPYYADWIPDYWYFPQSRTGFILSYTFHYYCKLYYKPPESHTLTHINIWIYMFRLTTGFHTAYAKAIFYIGCANCANRIAFSPGTGQEQMDADSWDISVKVNWAPIREPAPWRQCRVGDLFQ